MLQKINKKLLTVLSISFFLHLVAVLVATVFVVLHIVRKDDVILEAPSLPQSITPPKTEYQVSLDKLKKKTSPARLSPIVAKTVTDLSAPTITINPQSPVVSVHLNTNADKSFADGFRSLAGSGIGLTTFAKVKLFGIETDGERFFILVDASRDLVTDERGGLPAYHFVKERIVEVIENLPSGVQFNVAVFDNRDVYTFSSEMMRASEENKERLHAWIEPINKETYTGTLGNNANFDSTVEPLFANARFMARALNEAMRQRPDNIFVLTTGWHHMGHMFNIHSDQVAWSEYLRRYHDYSDQEVEEYYAEIYPLWKKYHGEKRDFADKELARENKIREQKGMPARILGTAEFGKYAEGKGFPDWAKYSNGKKFPLPPRVERSHFDDYIDELAKRFYVSEGKTPPRLNNIVFLARDTQDAKQIDQNKNDEAWLRRLAGRYDGKFDKVKLAETIKRTYENTN